MEEDREAIERLKRTHGYEGREAEVAYHLGRAQDLLAEMYEEIFSEEGGPMPKTAGGLFQAAHVAPHFRALFALIDKRVLVRDYPERLGMRAPDED